MIFYTTEELNLLESAMQVLTVEERFVIRARHGLPYPEHTLEDCATIFKVTKERIRQIQDDTIKKLKSKFRKKKLKYWQI